MQWIASDNTQEQDVNPATQGIYTGAAFQNQAPVGTRQVDTFDDRVTYEANIETTVPQAVSIGLGNDMDAAGTSADGTSLSRRFLQALNPTRKANLPPRSDIDAVIVNVGNGGSFDETQYRPWAGLPLSGTSDQQWAADTNDMIGDTINTPFDYLQRPGERRIMERTLAIPDRLSEHPTQSQAIRPWDVLLGAWPWSGNKAAQQRPVSAQPLNFDTPIHDGIPSPTGAGGESYMVNSLGAMPLTFRTAPSPWDTGTDGTFVDSGQ